MVIVEVSGGLGNQLNAYAYYTHLKRLGKNVKIDTHLYDTFYEFRGGSTVDRAYELDKLGLHPEICTSKEHIAFADDDMHFFQRLRRLVRGSSKNVCDIKNVQDIDNVSDCYVVGSFNPVEHCVAKDIDFIRNEIQYVKSNNEKNIEALHQIGKENSVSIHIRRTDYLEAKNSNGNIATESYYESAISHIKERVDSPIFYVFSDDKEYIRKKYVGDEFRIVDWNSDENNIYDLQLMSACKHNIAVKSTFSQWAGRLNKNADKIVIIPVEMGGPTYSVEKEFVWIDVEGNMVNCP